MTGSRKLNTAMSIGIHYRSNLNPKEVKSTMLKEFLTVEEGQTLVEYGLLISLIALVVIAVLTVLGKKVSNTFNAAGNIYTS
jgi:pilus assembly protein Flp/PilA